MYCMMRESAPSFHEMKGDRDGKSAKTKKLSSAVVVNDHNMYIPIPSYIIFHVFVTPFGSNII